MEGESLEEMRESLRKGVKECETKKEVKRRKKGSAIAGGTQIAKEKRETYTKRIKMEERTRRKEGVVRLRREFKEKCKEKEEKNRKRIEEEIKKITTEAQISEFVNLDGKKPG